MTTESQNWVYNAHGVEAHVRIKTPNNVRKRKWDPRAVEAATSGGPGVSLHPRGLPWIDQTKNLWIDMVTDL